MDSGVKIIYRYSSQNLEVLNSVEAFLLCNSFLDLPKEVDIADQIRLFATEHGCELLTRASSILGALVIHRVADGYKIEVRRITDVSKPSNISSAMGAGNEWQSGMIDEILHFCETCIADDVLMICSVSFIDNSGKYFLYDFRKF